MFDSGHGQSTEEQEYNPTPIINEIRRYVEDWRNLRNPDQWQVTPETARLLQHWRHNQLIGIGGHLAMPPLPHHRAYGSVPRRLDWVKLG